MELGRRTYTIRNAELARNGRAGQRTFRNFKGEGGPYNTPGNRNFVLYLEPEDAEALKKEGWPVRYRPDYRRNHEGEERPQLKVNVKYRTLDGRPMTPPEITVITSRNHVKYGEEEVALLDFMEFEKVDLILNAYPSKNSFTGEDTVGVSLKTMFATLEEDELTAEYNERFAEEDAPF